MKKRNYLSDVEDRSGNAFSVIADFEGNEEQLMDIEVEEVLPILPLRNMVLFPGVFMPHSTICEKHFQSAFVMKIFSFFVHRAKFLQFDEKLLCVFLSYAYN